LNVYAGIGDARCANDMSSKGEKVTFKAHGGLLDIQGMTVAKVDEGFKVQSLETWFDPLEMFRQLTPKDIKVDKKSLSAESAEAFQTLGCQLEGEENPKAGAPDEAHNEDRSQAPGVSGCPFASTR
jgi:hypothetical protein